MLSMFALGTFSLVLVVELGVYADPNVSRNVHEFVFSYEGAKIFVVNGLTIPVSVWLQLAAFELLCLIGAFSALRRSCRFRTTLLMSICGVGYIVCAVIPLYFSQVARLMFG
jgi:hypothetical protein